jgi:hypothetical protein
MLSWDRGKSLLPLIAEIKNHEGILIERTGTRTRPRGGFLHCTDWTRVLRYQGIDGQQGYTLNRGLRH